MKIMFAGRRSLNLFVVLAIISISVICLLYDPDPDKVQQRYVSSGASRITGGDLDITKVEQKKYNASVKRIFYNMVPKCASKSFRLLSRNLSFTHHFYTSQGFTQPYVTSTFHLSREGIINTAKGIQSLSEPFIFFKHLNHIDFPKYGYNLDLVYINVIRDPIDRLESFYYYRRAINKRSKITYHGEIAVDFFQGSDSAEQYRRAKMPFGECVMNNDPECTDVRFLWTIVPHFCGHDYICHTPTRNALNLAMKNVIDKFAVVGYVSRYIEFLEVLEKILPQFFKGAVDTHNYLTSTADTYSHKTGFSTEKLSQEARDKLMASEVIQLEYEFYDFVVRRFKIVYEAYMGRTLS